MVSPLHPLLLPSAPPTPTYLVPSEAGPTVGGLHGVAPHYAHPPHHHTSRSLLALLHFVCAASQVKERGHGGEQAGELLPGVGEEEPSVTLLKALRHSQTIHFTYSQATCNKSD